MSGASRSRSRIASEPRGAPDVHVSQRARAPVGRREHQAVEVHDGARKSQPLQPGAHPVRPAHAPARPPVSRRCGDLGGPPARDARPATSAVVAIDRHRPHLPRSPYRTDARTLGACRLQPLAPRCRSPMRNRAAVSVDVSGAASTHDMARCCGARSAESLAFLVSTHRSPERLALLCVGRSADVEARRGKLAVANAALRRHHRAGA